MNVVYLYLFKQFVKFNSSLCGNIWHIFLFMPVCLCAEMSLISLLNLFLLCFNLNVKGDTIGPSLISLLSLLRKHSVMCHHIYKKRIPTTEVSTRNIKYTCFIDWQKQRSTCCYPRYLWTLPLGHFCSAQFSTLLLTDCSFFLWHDLYIQKFFLLRATLLS